MSKEASALMKEWKPSDLRRLRNLTDGKYTDAIRTQVGYEKEIVKREEGEIFEENGKTYVMHLGLKRRKTKLSALRESAIIPLFCPCCNKPLGKQIDQRMYKLNKVCLDCQIDFEAKLKREGKFKEYQEKFINSNYKAELIDFRNYVTSFVKSQNHIINSQGESEVWDNPEINIDEMLEILDERIANA